MAQTFRIDRFLNKKILEKSLTPSRRFLKKEATPSFSEDAASYLISRPSTYSHTFRHLPVSSHTVSAQER